MVGLRLAQQHGCLVYIIIVTKYVAEELFSNLISEFGAKSFSALF